MSTSMIRNTVNAARKIEPPALLAFGIPSLDELLGHPPDREEFGLLLDGRDKSTSICIIGPDGTGKSVLALHLASHYAAMTASASTRVFYASTDLADAKARGIWESFALDRPYERQVELEKVLHRGRARARKPPEQDSIRIQLDRYHPLTPSCPPGIDASNSTAKPGSQFQGASTSPLTDYVYFDPRLLCGAREREQVCHHGSSVSCWKGTNRICHRVAFIDLEATTAGDDWAFLNRLLATLDRPDPDLDRHLLIIDAVEGLETLGGKRDVFGHERERRSRIAQILRAAKNKCHVVFIVEEPRENERLPEEFVSDAVIRLRVERQRDYSRRAIEIDKLRGQAYVRGRHDCVIRLGGGSETGRQQNPDDRAFRLPGSTKSLSYLHVIHSLHYLSREIMESPLPPDYETDSSARSQVSANSDPRADIVLKQPRGLAGFGIRYLDEMIGDQGLKAMRRNRVDGELVKPFNQLSLTQPVHSDRFGLPWGSMTALIGDDGTYKQRLGRAFLAQAFGNVDAHPGEMGVALMLTTKPVDSDILAAKFLNHQSVPGSRTDADLKEQYEKWLARYKKLAPKVSWVIADLAVVSDLQERLQDLLESLSAATLSTPTAREFLQSIAKNARQIIEVSRPIWRALHATYGRLDTPKKLRETADYLEKTVSPRMRPEDVERTMRSVAWLRKSASLLDEQAEMLKPIRDLYFLLQSIGTLVLEDLVSQSARDDAMRRQHSDDESMSAGGTPLPTTVRKRRQSRGETTKQRTRARLQIEAEQSLSLFDKRIRDLMRPRGPVSESVKAVKALEAAVSHVIDLADSIRRIAAIKQRTVCRRLEVHHMTPAVLFNVIHSLVEEGLFEIFWQGQRPASGSQISPVKAPGRVRLVIDNWSDILHSYPEIREDPLFLPFVSFYLKRRGITTLFIDTQPGRLSHILSNETDRELRALVPYHLYTWHVTFYGEKRVAITALPPISNDQRVVVRELKPLYGRDEQLIVDPHFELYAGFDGDAAPRVVPLQVRLYHEDTAATDYFEDVTALFSRLYGRFEVPGKIRERALTDLKPSISAQGGDDQMVTNCVNKSDTVVQLERSATYEMLRDFAYLQGKSALEHTLVVQVDEFWSPEGESLLDMTPYLEADTYDPVYGGDAVEDPFGLFQATQLDPGADTDRPTTRGSCFVPIGYDLPGSRVLDEDLELRSKANGRKSHSAIANVSRTVSEAGFRRTSDRVPYTLDFGILLADRARWTDSGVGSLKVGVEKIEINEIWRALSVPAELKPNTDPSRQISWRQFLEACWKVAANSPHCHQAGQPVDEITVLPFDVDLSTLESLSCLMLEVWASEIYRVDENVARIFPPRRDAPTDFGLVELIDREEGRHRRALFRAWLLVNAVLAPEQFPRENFRLHRERPWPNAVACRHWYATASPVAMEQERSGRQLTPLRLPGHFTTRGDWFLGIAAGSRSRRLGERAIDLLTSRRANITRMQRGLGMPVRGFSESIMSEDGHWSDAEFRTPFRTYDEDHSGRPRRLRLHDMLWLGGHPMPRGIFKAESIPSLFHLWRSRLRGYDRHARIWFRWLIYAFDSMHHRETPAPHKLEFGDDLFSRYDDLEAWMLAPDASQKTDAAFSHFNRLCDELSASLRRATPRWTTL